MSSKDDLPEDLPIEDLKIIQAKFELDDKSAEAVRYITQNVPLAGLRALIGEDWFTREIIKDITTADMVSCPSCRAKVPVSVSYARSRALTMFGQMIGVLSGKNKASPKQVEFQDE